MGSFAVTESEILIFGGDQGWTADCYSFDTKSCEIERIDCPLKKPEEFFRSQPVWHAGKVFCCGNLDKDVHVFLPEARRWFMLEKWFVNW